MWITYWNIRATTFSFLCIGIAINFNFVVRCIIVKKMENYFCHDILDEITRYYLCLIVLDFVTVGNSSV